VVTDKVNIRKNMKHHDNLISKAAMPLIAAYIFI